MHWHGDEDSGSCFVLEAYKRRVATLGRAGSQVARHRTGYIRKVSPWKPRNAMLVCGVCEYEPAGMCLMPAMAFQTLGMARLALLAADALGYGADDKA